MTKLLITIAALLLIAGGCYWGCQSEEQRIDSILQTQQPPIPDSVWKDTIPVSRRID
jgi:hypothetical protein